MSMAYISIPTKLECPEPSSSSPTSTSSSSAGSSIFSLAYPSNSSNSSASNVDSSSTDNHQSALERTKSIAKSCAISLVNLLKPLDESSYVTVEIESPDEQVSTSLSDRVQRMRKGVFEHLAGHTPSFMVPSKQLSDMTPEEREAELERRYKKMCPQGPATLVQDMDLSDYDFFPKKDTSVQGLGFGLNLPKEYSLLSVDPTPLRNWEARCGPHQPPLPPTALDNTMSPIVPLPSSIVRPLLSSLEAPPLDRLPSPHWSDDVLGMYTANLPNIFPISENLDEFVEIDLRSPVLGETVAPIMKPNSEYAVKTITVTTELRDPSPDFNTSLSRDDTTELVGDLDVDVHQQEVKSSEARNEAATKSKYGLIGLGLPSRFRSSNQDVNRPSQQQSKSGSPLSTSEKTPTPQHPRQFTTRSILPRSLSKSSIKQKRSLFSIPESPAISPRSAASPRAALGRFTSKTFFNSHSSSQSTFSWFSKAGSSSPSLAGDSPAGAKQSTNRVRHTVSSDPSIGCDKQAKPPSFSSHEASRLAIGQAQSRIRQMSRTTGLLSTLGKDSSAVLDLKVLF